MIKDLSILATLWAVYLVVHSVLASKAFKKNFVSPQSHRKLFSLIAIIGLVGILLFQATIPANHFFASNQLSQILGLSLGMAGVQIIRLAFRKTSAKAFLGLVDEGPSTLITDGIYARVRHPLYTATILLGLGFFVFYPSPSIVVMLAVWFAYLPIGIRFEEKKLIEQFGEDYTTYKETVYAVFPHLL